MKVVANNLLIFFLQKPCKKPQKLITNLKKKEEIIKDAKF